MTELPAERDDGIPLGELRSALTEFLDRLCITPDSDQIHNVVVSSQGVRLTYLNDSTPVSTTLVEQHGLTT
jgi:hypothetical protein